MEQQRAPRPTPEKQYPSNASTLKKQFRRASSGENYDKTELQGPKITGIGTNSVAADHTLTLIFDSDEEMPNEYGLEIPTDRLASSDKYNKAID